MDRMRKAVRLLNIRAYKPLSNNGNLNYEPECEHNMSPLKTIHWVNTQGCWHE